MTSREWNQLDPAVRRRIEQFQRDAPVRLPNLARELGVPVKSATLAPGISGEIRPNDGNGFVIRVNRHDAHVRQRFTVAHELAHFLLHSENIGDGIEDDILYRSTLSDRREQEANRLAADILMPDQLVQNEYNAARENGIEDIVLHLAGRFGVSEAAMRIKLGS